MNYLLPVFFLLFTCLAQGKVYKWKDAQGNTHYSETKPNNYNVKEMKINHFPVEAKGSDQDLKREHTRKQETTLRLQKFAEQDKHRRDKEKAWKSRCKQAKKSMQELKKSFSNKKIDPNTGGYIYPNHQNKSNIIVKQKERIRRKQIYINKMCRRI